ncbi:TPA: Cox family DNA-binding protein [Yersinia enterocolitica]
MKVEDYVIRYPLDAVHESKFAELIGKSETSVREMTKNSKLPVIELRDPSKVNARVGEKWIYIPEFNRAVKEAFYLRPIEQRDAWLLWMGL